MDGDQVPLGDDLVGPDPDVGEGGAEHRRERLHRPSHVVRRETGYRSVFDAGVRNELIDGLEVAVAEHVVVEATNNGLVGFRDGSLPLIDRLPDDCRIVRSPVEMSRDLADLLDESYRAMNAAIIERLAASGHAAIRPAHAKVFEHIGRDGARVADMAAAAQITKQSMSELVDDLQAAGYVERIADPADRRAKIVRLTDAGWDAVVIARHVLEGLHRQLRQRLGERRYNGLLSDLIAVLQEISG